jgi:hypothetical protein
MSSKSRHDHESRVARNAQRRLASIPGPVRDIVGARSPSADAPTTIDDRIAQTKGAIENLDRVLGKLKQKAEEVEAQLLKAMGALEMLEALKADGLGGVTSNPTRSDASQGVQGDTRPSIPDAPASGTVGDPREPESDESDMPDDWPEEQAE